MADTFMTTVITSVAVLFAAGLFAALSIAGGMWNLVDAIALYLHRAANRGRARSLRVTNRLGRSWTDSWERGVSYSTEVEALRYHAVSQSDRADRSALERTA